MRVRHSGFVFVFWDLSFDRPSRSDTASGFWVLTLLAVSESKARWLSALCQTAFWDFVF